MNIGILGGTFDPIHSGHLAIADHVLKKLNLARIEFIPCYQPPHRLQPIASPENRLAMTTLAIENHPKFAVNMIEIKRQSISYTVDTLLALHKQFPKNNYSLILGADAFAQFDSWHDWETICQLADIVVVSRDDQEIHTPIKVTHFMRKNPSKKQIHFVIITPIPISATQIRADIAAKKQTVPGLIDSVYQYIVKNNVY